MFCDTIGRLFLNLRTVFFTSFHFVSGLSSKVHCFNIVMLGASSLFLMKVSVRRFKFLVNRIFFEPKKQKWYQLMMKNYFILTYCQSLVLFPHYSLCPYQLNNQKLIWKCLIVYFKQLVQQIIRIKTLKLKYCSAAASNKNKKH